MKSLFVMSLVLALSACAKIPIETSKERWEAVMLNSYNKCAKISEKWQKDAWNKFFPGKTADAWLASDKAKEASAIFEGWLGKDCQIDPKKVKPGDRARVEELSS